MSDTNAPQTELDRSRENWLRRAAVEFRVWIEKVSGIVVPDVHVSIGFGGHSYERNVAACCYPGSASADGQCQIFISPESGDTADILISLLHELIHAARYAAGHEKWKGHRDEFAEYATRLGLTAPFTSSEPDMATAAQMMVMAAELGPFPHAKLTVRAPKPVTAPDGTLVSVGAPELSSTGGTQVNRWIVFHCPTHKRPTRMSATAGREGAPYCGHKDEQGVPCLTEMVAK